MTVETPREKKQQPQRKRRSRATGRPLGRPLVDGAKRDFRVTFTVPAAETQTYDKAAAALNLDRAALVRTAVRHYLRHVLPKRISAEQLAEVRGGAERDGGQP